MGSPNMWMLEGWRQIACNEREDLMAECAGSSVRPFSSLTDLDGNFGTPIIYTEWAFAAPDRAILRDYRWPDSPEKSCEHWVPANGTESREPEPDDD